MIFLVEKPPPRDKEVARVFRIALDSDCCLFDAHTGRKPHLGAPHAQYRVGLLSEFIQTCSFSQVACEEF